MLSICEKLTEEVAMSMGIELEKCSRKAQTSVAVAQWFTRAKTWNKRKRPLCVQKIVWKTGGGCRSNVPEYNEALTM